MEYSTVTLRSHSVSPRSPLLTITATADFTDPRSRTSFPRPSLRGHAVRAQPRLCPSDSSWSPSAPDLLARHDAHAPRADPGPGRSRTRSRLRAEQHRRRHPRASRRRRFMPLLMAIFFLVVGMNITGVIPGSNIAGTSVDRPAARASRCRRLCHIHLRGPAQASRRGFFKNRSSCRVYRSSSCR